MPDQGKVCVHRGLPTGIYTTTKPEECQFVADDCKANIIVVEDQKQLDKILKVNLILATDSILFAFTIIHKSIRVTKTWKGLSHLAIMWVM